MRASSALPSGDVQHALITLHIDAWTVDVIAAFERAGIRTMLLKGPVIAAWLYGDGGSTRRYCDADLLVGPADSARAAALLVDELGFVAHERPLIEADEHHARIFERARDGADVDLHRTLHGLESVPFDAVWAMASRHSATMDLLGTTVTVPDPVLRTLNVAMHLDPLDDETSQSWRDLELALDPAFAGQARWFEALELARSLGVEAELAVRLRRVPAGRELADRLGMTRTGSTYYNLVGAVTSGEVPPWAYAISRFGMQHGIRAKSGYVFAKLFPPAAQLRAQSRLARRGRVGFGVARINRVLTCGWRLPQAVAIYVREARR